MHRIITIGRQYASGGSQVGSRLSELMEIPCYDREALVAIAEKHGIPRETFEKADEQATSSFLYSLAMSAYNGGISAFGANDHIITDRVFSIQSEEMKRLASEGDCIFVGRCADDVLSSFDKVLNVFVYTSNEERIKAIMRLDNLDEQAARKLINRSDKKRASYYNFYTGKTWGDAKNYHLTIDSGALDVEGTAQIIKDFAEMFFAIK